MRCLADDGGVPPAKQKTFIFPGLIKQVQGEREAEGALPWPPVEVLEGHEFAGLNPRRLHEKPEIMANTATFTGSCDDLGTLPEASRPPEADDPFGYETCYFVLACHRSMTRGGALACLQIGVHVATIFTH